MGAGTIVTLLLIAGLGWLIRSAYRKNPKHCLVPGNTAELLEEHVAFYRNLTDEAKPRFEARVKKFLENTAIRGVKVVIDDRDRVLVAAGAIIPIFAFDDWEYRNINEVLIYPGTFTKKFSLKGAARNVLGMVGDGAMNGTMILSQPSIRMSFQNSTDGHNTVIHEFVHLVDKADGAVDGIPEYLLAKPYMQPWINKIHETIRGMLAKSKSDINMYGATNEAEFFAVVSEYFFERPGDLKLKHPELYEMLEHMFTGGNKSYAK